MFFIPECANSVKKHDWQHILGTNMISNTFWEKHDWQHILGKTHDWRHILGKKHDWSFCGNNMIGSTCCEEKHN
jgi:hypothetical protein